MTEAPEPPLDQSIKIYDQHYRARGMASQRTYPNESLIQFLASRWFNWPVAARRSIRILEVGCGSGANLWMMAKEGFDTYGIDSSREGLALAASHLSDKWNVQAHLQLGSFTHMPYSAGSFDAVVDVVSLQGLTLADSAIALAEVGRVLKPSGAFFSYRLSDRSTLAHAAAHIDSVTIENIADPTVPLANNGPLSFWSEQLAREMYAQAGLVFESVERAGRTYASGVFVEYLRMVATKGE